MEICYELATSDHIPIVAQLDVENVPLLSRNNNAASGCKLDWSKLSNEVVAEYSLRTENLLNNIALPHEALICTDMNCKDVQHVEKICAMYDCIVKCLNVSSEPLCKSKCKVLNSRPGWKEFVAEKYAEAREAFRLWTEAGKPRHGVLLDMKKQANARFKYALRFIKKNENTMRADSLARKLLNNNLIDFWQEVKVMNSNKTSLLADIEGISSSEKIAELWREHYRDLFNCVKSNPVRLDHEHIKFSVDMIVTAADIHDAINKLENNKACGMDCITAEHLKYASHKLCPFLSMCFNGCLVHGVLPNAIISVMLLPVLKDKAGKRNSIDNYRPIALASILSKVLERILLSMGGLCFIITFVASDILSQ